MKTILTITACILLFPHLSGAQSKRAMTPEDLFQIKSVKDPHISPDGKWIAFTVSEPILEEDRCNSDIWLLSLQGGEPKQLTYSSENDCSPRWSLDGNHLAFISARDSVENIYLIDVRGGEAKKLTDSKTDLYDPLWSKDGKVIICGSRVLPEGKEHIENWTAEQLPKCKARNIDHLLFRQWDEWLGDDRNHIFGVDAANGTLKDLTPDDFDTPPVSLSSHHDYDIAPDGSEICYVANKARMPATSTNHDIFIKNLKSGQETKLTTNPALDSQPHYSPDGRYIAYTAMEKIDYEADREVLTLYDRKENSFIRLTESLDRSVREIVWNKQSNKIFFTAPDEGRSSIFQVDLKGEVKRLTNEGYNTYLSVHPNGDQLVFVRSYNHQPGELFVMSTEGGQARKLTTMNATLLAELDLPELDEFWFTGADDTRVHGFIQRPPDFDPAKKYPVILTIHGGPQGMWADKFMTTWLTFQLVSSPGYVGVFINPRGSLGYGSTFKEEVSLDYGGKCYDDLMKGLDYVIANYDFVDADKQAAIGGSFGGYSVNWIMGHTDRFDCVVSHAGLYNLISFYGATEELWFPAWDMGSTPWDEPELYNKWSPHNYVNNFKTPTLVTHGELDYRVPFAESLQLFTALQRNEIPSNLIVFHDEGHVINGLQNNLRWWKEIHRWFETYLK
jgi:dipeptidyl aminopeptidase/acylaminoacyl peptidase